MNNHLIIKDLNYIEQAKEITVVGGDDVVAITGTSATTGPGYASAGGVALAAGQITNIQIQTQATGSFSLSLADARASAYAKTGNDTAVSLSSSNSSWRTTGNYRSNSLSFNSTTTA